MIIIINNNNNLSVVYYKLQIETLIIGEVVDSVYINCHYSH